MSLIPPNPPARSEVVSNVPIVGLREDVPRKPIYRVILNMDADGGMWITNEHGEGVFIDFHLEPNTVDQLEIYLANKHVDVSRLIDINLNCKMLRCDTATTNLQAALNFLHGIFWKAKDRARAQREGDGEDKVPADE